MYHVTVPGRKKGSSGRKECIMLLYLGGRKEHRGGRNLLVKILVLLGCYEAWIVVSYQRFGSIYRYHFQRSSSPKK